MKKFVLIFALAALLLLPGATNAEEMKKDFFCIEHPEYPFCGASSRLKDDEIRDKYHEKNLFDGSKKTGWVVSKTGDGTGEEVWFQVEPGLGELLFINGFTRGDDLYRDNNRIKTLKARLWVAIQKPGRVSEMGALFSARPALPPWTIELKDTPILQVVDIDLDWTSAQKAMEKLIDDTAAFDRCAYILTLTIQEIYPGNQPASTGLTEISWNLHPEYSGPGGLGVLDLRGSWENEKGSPWEYLELEWYPFFQGWTAYIDNEPYDAGEWEIGNGRLKLYSHGKMKQYYFEGWPQNRNRLLLIDDDGEFSTWQHKW